MTSNSPYAPQSYISGYSPLRERSDYQRQYQVVPPASFSAQLYNGVETSRIRDFKQ